MNGFLYILQSKANGHYYIGSSLAPDRRFSQHNANAVAATRGKGPWIRLALVSFESVAIAKKAERFIKRQKSRRIIEMVIAEEFTWPDSFPR